MSMLDSFWSSLEIEEISDLNYTDYTSYTNEEQKEAVLEKIDWVLLKLYPIRDKRKYDYDIVTKIKNKIRMHNASLTLKGIDYLNLITSDLKEDTF
jgi:hypothetical protein